MTLVPYIQMLQGSVMSRQELNTYIGTTQEDPKIMYPMIQDMLMVCVTCEPYVDVMWFGILEEDIRRMCHWNREQAAQWATTWEACLIERIACGHRVDIESGCS